MLTILDEKEQRTADSVEMQYPDSIFLLINFTDIENPKGNLYCISRSLDSLNELNRIASDFAQKNIPCIIMGNYNNGGAPGVQYEVEK